MKVISREPKENSTVELVIEVDAATFDAAIQAVYRKQVGRFNVPGFRKGKAPRKIIESMYGTGVFYEDAVNETYPDAYDAAVAAEALAPVARPDLEILSVGKEGLTFRATVTVRPPVTLGQYKGLRVERDDAAVTEADIDGELKPLIERATRIVPVERAAALGDTVVLDFEGFENDVPFEGGKADGYSLELGSGSFIPGFEDGVVGLSAGEERDIPLTFPEDYAAELAGKDVVFHVKVHEVKARVEPELDDEFAKDVSEFETLAELRRDLGEKLTARRAEQADQGMESALLRQVAEGITVELPDAMVEYQTEKVLEDYETTLKNRGMSLEQYMSFTGTTQEMMLVQAQDTARERLLRELALEEIAAAEGLTISEEERAAEYTRLAGQYSIAEEMVRSAVPEKSVDSDLLARKAVALIKESATVSAPAAQAEEPAKKPARKPAKKAEDAPAEQAEKPAKKPAKKATKKTAAPKSEDAE